MTRSVNREGVLKLEIAFRWRVLFYLVPWLCTVAAFSFIIYPESACNTAESVLEQALRLPVLTPFLAVLGVVHSFWGPGFPNPAAGFFVAIGFLAHAGIVLSSRRLVPLITLLALQALMLGIAVTGFVHLSKLPSGG